MPVGVGVVVAGGVVTVSDGTGLGAGWVGTGVVTPGTGTTADGTAEGTQTGSASDTCGVGRDDDGAWSGASPDDCVATVAGFPASLVADDAEAVA